MNYDSFTRCPDCFMQNIFPIKQIGNNYLCLCNLCNAYFLINQLFLYDTNRKNVQITQPWIIRACKNEELIFAMFTVKKDGQIQLYQTGEIRKEDMVKQLRYIADQLERKKIIIPLRG